MKPRRTAWWVMLVATHAAVFLMARPTVSSSAAGDGAGTHGPNVTAAAPAKASNRGRGGQRMKKSSAHTGLLAELNASDLKGEAYEQARLAILRDWIKRDLRGALLAIYGPEAGDRHENVVPMLEDDLHRELLARSGQVAGWISSGYFGSRHSQVAQIWAKALVKGGQRDAVAAALPDLPGGSRVVAIDELCQTAKGSAELALLRPWMAPDSQEKLDDYARRVVRFSGDDVEKIFRGEEDPKIQEVLCDAYLERFLKDAPPQQAVAALAKLPEAYRLETLGEIAGGGDLGTFTALLAEVDRQGLWQGISEEDQEGLVKSSIEAICGDYSLPEDVFHELSGIARPELRLAALRKAGKEMGDANLAVEVLGTLPRGAELDAFILGLTGAEDFISAEAWPRLLECASDPSLRETLEEMRTGRQDVAAEVEADEEVLPPIPAD